MALTAKQEAFAQAIADGLNQSDAYRKAYNASKSTDKSVNELASALLKNIKVASRVAELRGALQESALWSREDSVRALRSIANGGEARPGEIVSAIKELNAMHGYEAPKKIEGDLTMTMRWQGD